MTLMVDTTKRRLATPEVVAGILGVEVQTLACWRSTGRYPELEYIRLTPRCVRYDLDVVDRFIESRRVGAAQGNNE